MDCNIVFSWRQNYCYVINFSGRKVIMVFRFFKYWLLAIAMMVGVSVHAALPQLDQFGTLQSNVPIPSVVAPDVKTLTLDSGMFVEGQHVDATKLPSMWVGVDPSKVYLGQETTIKIWLVGDGAGYTNVLGIGLNGDYTLNDHDPQVVFGSINLGGIVQYNDPTDQVHQDTVGPGKLDFFLIANGANAETLYQLYWTDMAPKPPVSDADVNADGMEHALAFLWTDPSNLSDLDYLVYAWEDLPQGVSDLDFNDVFALVEVSGVVIAPEPSTYLVMGSFLLFAYTVHRRRKALV